MNGLGSSSGEEGNQCQMQGVRMERRQVLIQRPKLEGASYRRQRHVLIDVGYHRKMSKEGDSWYGCFTNAGIGQVLNYLTKDLKYEALAFQKEAAVAHLHKFCY